MNSVRSLVVGASGFIGTWLCQSAVTQCKVFGTYLTNASVTVENCDYFQMDVRDSVQTRDVISRLKPEIIFLIAGVKDIGYCEQNPDDAFNVHVEGVNNVLNAAVGVTDRLIYLSTDSVFNGKEVSCTEFSNPNPINQYGKTKYEGERIVRDSRLSTVTVRSSLQYGWNFPGQGTNTVIDVIHSLEQQQIITLPSTLYNTPINVSEAVHAIWNLALTKLEGVFHLAGPTRISRYELGVVTAKEFDFDTSLVQSTSHTSGLRPTNSCLVAHKLERALKVKFSNPSFGLRTMRKQTNLLAGIKVFEDLIPQSKSTNRFL